VRPDPRAASDAAWNAQRGAKPISPDAAPIDVGESHARPAKHLAAEATKLNGEASAGSIIIDDRAPYATAKLFAERYFRAAGARTLYHHRGAFYRWAGAAYAEVPDDALRAQLYPFLDRCIGAKRKPVKPNAALVRNVVDGLRAATHLDETAEPPAWVDRVPDLPMPADVIACANGLLHIPTQTLLPLTPDFFTLNALDFGFNPEAPRPDAWLEFLSQLWADDPEAVDALQEIFGYCLTGDTRHQKAFLLVGPKRSGKGTIGRVFRALIGQGNTVAPTLAALGTNFGLAPLIGKRVAIISDARLGGRADQQAIAERLLSITGEDAITIDRKFRDAWTGRLQTRFLILSNELPRLADASGALASRFIVLTLSESFYGREDLRLTDRLLAELTGILNWALAGLVRLRHHGHFVQPASSIEAAQALEDLGSPVGAFLRDCCRTGPQFRVERSELYRRWCDWCETQGRDHPGALETFGRDLRAALPMIKSTQPRNDDGGRRRFYQGVGLR
jgi:putative DNA primase/helicase